MCERLEFYLDRPDLETEFSKRLEFCKTTIKDVSPIRLFYVNPILSDLKVCMELMVGHVCKCICLLIL